MRITVFANTVHTNTLTGGDRIFAECAKRWASSGHEVVIVTNEVGAAFCRDLGVYSRALTIWKASRTDACGVYIAMLSKALLSMLRAMSYARHKADIAFASSFFVPDLIPALFLKFTNPRATFAAACYLFTTEPWGMDYSGGKLKGLLFFINERIAFFLLKHFGGLVITASEFDRREFIRAHRFPPGRVLALRGGVDTKFFRTVPSQTLRYDGVFVGRFHPQKCVGELIDIWEKVVSKDARRVLALVGSGPEENELRRTVSGKKLGRNIIFLGPADGEVKSKILKSSRIFVSASRYDSGNIALDEALGCGIPGIVYDLPRLNYPKGVLKIPTGDVSRFVRAIDRLLEDDRKRKKLGEDSLEFSLSLDWDEKAKELLAFMAT